ncbi:DUF4192 domain-containing protein [Jatrophihabitans endophyticus]|uniref:DUF4192 domain-containing protein n=1 Tax=Jatrophihabitans endophyticus TaxID=1206085 RepID=UPI0019F966BB|nr:DUF4192 domain-containing protein [Jatrophihabitans endophyticus]MBE7186870.1 DUF4192 domain-containing protein [Jatrophihabitans endophyticus]
MTTSTRRPRRRAQPIRGAGELVQAIPYLIGYHPAESAVFVGLRDGQLMVTARLDLDDPDLTDVLLDHTVSRAVAGGATEFVVVVYTDDGETLPPDGVAPPVPRHQADDDDLPRLLARPGVDVAREAACAVVSSGARLLDVLLVRAGRWWSYVSAGPADGWALDGAPSPFVAEAIVEGTAPQSNRAAASAALDPCPDDERAELDDHLAHAVSARAAATRNGGRSRYDRAARRAVLDAVAASHRPGWAPPPHAELARLAVALTDIEIRDDVWLAIEGGRVDGRPLTLELARRCPSPYDVAPLFLYGWACWRAGNSMLAGVAARRALASDPGCTAARLLSDAVDQAVAPHRLPRLKRPRGPR